MKIDIEGYENATIEVLPTNILFIDTYQRNVRENLVKKIAKNIDVVKLGCIVVSLRKNGSYAVVDGQHRLQAMRLAGYEKALCIVFKDIKKPEEAKKFIGFNKDRASMTATQIFWAEIESEDPRALLILRIAESEGFEITRGVFGKSGHNTSDTIISAVGSLKTIYIRTGEIGLQRTMYFVSKVWKDDSKRVQGSIMLGISIFLAKHAKNPKFSIKRAIEKINDVSIATVLKRSVNVREIYNMGTGDAVSVVLTEIYNTRLSQLNRL